ncbi:hypothetical protein [Clostridium estertheticum]|uniref:hypothetical protein n=1 Tax=Clostridium estertheticum TaxID=238834 RepID=UPI001C7DFFA8|nr:hypothetical protein [Clostridium estertheticum]MBX4267193.1 hypothetical protein [Clostridium estertheticum]MBX4272063.1 hypothetical protein [Clostridium estertheticum]WLC82441.1 hypothetical protein KTC98_23985 [Clostridium estertheticum]WLC91315.1 hypothetical protein KTC95_23955 [Clostridium estertheticum]
MSMFTSISLEDIGNAVKLQIVGFDDRMNSLSTVLSFGLNEPAYSKFYNIANDISLAIGGVCLAIAVIMAYTAIVKEGLTLKGDWKKIVTILLRLAITKGLIDSSTQFITWIYSFPAKITSIVIDHTSGKSKMLAEIFKPEDIANGLGITKQSGVIDKFVALQYAKFLGFAFFFLGIIIFIIALARILKIYTLLAFSALAFSKIPLYGIDGCKEYIKEMCALGLQGGIIATTVSLFEVGNTTIASICSTGIYGSLGSIFVLSISMLLLILKSEEIARKVI